MTNMHKNTLQIALILLISVINAQILKAQLNPMSAQYFNNQYLGNPAMAGMGGLNLNMGVRKQWSTIPGSPSTQSLSADYAMSNKAGLGLNLNNDKSGLFKHTRAVGTYAYHLPVSENNDRLSFGLSLGFMSERITNEDLSGDPDDMSVALYNQQSTYIDGDFGMAYSTKAFNIQFAFPNLKSVIKRDMINGSVNQSTFFSAISYKFRTGLKDGLEIEPKAVYRGINGLDNIFDIGANLSYGLNKLNFFGMYHSTKSTTFGLGMNYQSFGFSGMYTTSTSALNNYTNGDFELTIKAILFK